MKTQSAKLNHLHMTPRKVRLVANLIKGMSVNDAQAQLMLNPRRASEPVVKLLRSAIANAKNKQLNPDKLIVKEVRVDGGPMLKRWLPKAQGRATPIQKKSSHITIILAESEKVKGPRFKIVKQEKISKSKAEKIKSIEKHDHDHDHETKEKKESGLQEKSFGKRIFNRKAI